jgi:predicted AlkP superfamily pyrophosphatase or phosphodiesterase
MKIYVFLIDGMGYHYTPQSLQETFHLYPIENIEPTITAPNWISILTGKPSEEHKVINNESIRKKSFKLPVDTIFHDSPGILISDWKMLGKYIYSSKNKAKIKLNFQFIHTKAIWRFIHTEHTLMNSKLNFINTDKVDSIAHTYGWKSDKTNRVLNSVARNILKFTNNLLEKKEPFLIIITADHGGLKKEHEHSKYTKLIRHVPFGLYSNTLNVTKLPKIKSTLQIRKFITDIIIKYD